MIPDPAPPSNTEKEPEDWISGGDPIIGRLSLVLEDTVRENAKGKARIGEAPLTEP
jgi:hypothetical protein